MRLSVELTPDQHQRIKATAALQGKSIRSLVLERLLGDPSSEVYVEALDELHALLEKRIAAAASTSSDDASVIDIFTSVHNTA
jgi:hypothetical protein